MGSNVSTLAVDRAAQLAMLRAAMDAGNDFNRRFTSPFVFFTKHRVGTMPQPVQPPTWATDPAFTAWVTSYWHANPNRELERSQIPEMTWEKVYWAFYDLHRYVVNSLGGDLTDNRRIACVVERVRCIVLLYMKFVQDTAPPDYISYKCSYVTNMCKNVEDLFRQLNDKLGRELPASTVVATVSDDHSNVFGGAEDVTLAMRPIRSRDGRRHPVPLASASMSSAVYAALAAAPYESSALLAGNGGHPYYKEASRPNPEGSHGDDNPFA